MSRVQCPAFVLYARLVLMVVVLLGMLPGHVGAAVEKATAQPGVVSAPPQFSSSSASSLLPEFQSSSLPSLSSSEEPPPADDEFGTSVVAPEGAPAPQPSVMLAPGSLSLETSGYLLEAGEPVTVTVRVAPDGTGSTEGANLLLSLSPGLELLAGELAWALPDVHGLADGFAQELVVTAADAQPKAVYAVSASLGRTGFLTQTAQLLLGGESEAEVIVLTSPAMARNGLRVEVTEEWPIRGNAESSVSSEPSSVVGGLSSVYLPVVAGGGGGAQKDSDGFVRRWRIEANREREAVSVLEEAATILISTGEMEAEGVEVEKLQLWSREDENDEWRVAPARYLAEQQLFVAQTRHFSQWGMKDGLMLRGELLPTVKSFTADGFTGYAQVSYPIETPDGLGGMNPGLSLNYSSGVVDDMINFVGGVFYGAQASWVGYGWHLGGMSAISWDPANKKYYVNLGGSSVEIRQNGGVWVTEPNQFWRIERMGPTGNAQREDIQGWRITTKEGTQYEFGSTSYHPNGEPQDSFTEMIISDKDTRRPLRWNLRLVVDAVGNRMEYDYKKVDPDTESDLKVTGPYGSGIPGEARTQVHGSCVDGLTNWEQGYDSGSYLTEVRWSGNNNAGVSPRLRVLLQREPRPDWRIDGWSNDECVQARFVNERLKRVLVQAWHNNGDWHSLAEYELEYAITPGQNAPPAGQNAHHSLLTKIIHKGKDGIPILATTTFAYEGSYSMARLIRADNGQGGSVQYSYGHEEIHDCIGCDGGFYWASGLPSRDPVTQTLADDGIGGQVRTVYEYSGVKGHVTSNSFEYLGHGWSRVWRYTTDIGLGVSNRLEERVEDWYYQRLDGSTIDPRRGHSWQSFIYAANGADMQHIHRGWQYPSQSGVYWVYQDWEHVYTFDWDGNDNAQGRWTHFFYEGSYGNQTRVEERASNATTVLRKTETDYTFNTGAYIVNRPAQVRVYDGAGTCVGEVRHTYDGLGRLTRSDTPITACGDTNTANLIQSNRSYDGVGNVTREWTTGTSHDIRTVYDPDFKLFAVRRYNASNPNLDETGKYYGVNGADGVGNGLPVTHGDAFWGRMQEFCGMDNICTQQAYDGFGRPTARWERGVGYPTVGNAQTRWFYYRKGEYGGNANIVLEWSHPRCYGNFSRKLYNGFGQLIQSQGPDENWTMNMDGCNPGLAGGEVVVDYAYDGVGRQVRQSVPRSVPRWDWATSAPWAENWGNGYSETVYDALGRVLQSKDPSGRITNSYYSGLDSWSEVVSVETGVNNRLTSWQHQDELGRTTLLRSYVWTGAWTVDAEIQLSYNSTDRLVKTERRNGSSGGWTQLSSLSYDLTGRKLSMSDADLGSWTYAYDKLGQFTRQSDARSKSTCLAYNALGQVTAKTVYNANTCSGGVAASYAYIYDSLGRLGSVSGSNNWSKNLGYDSLGRPNIETVTIDGMAQTTTTYYDAYQRPYATRYPDNEVVKVNYNGLGLPKLMCSG